MKIRTVSETGQVDHFLQHADWLHSYLGSRIPPRHEASVSAEDLLQEVWKSCVRAPRDSVPDGLDDLRCWLAAIAHHELVDRLKELNSVKRGRGRIQAHRRYGLDSSVLDLFNMVSSPGRTPSAELSSTEAIQAVRRALASLPENRRQAIAMYHIEGRTREEIAERMGKSVAAVGSLLAEGRKQLRRLLGSASNFFSRPRLQVAEGQKGLRAM
ncbi:MAG: RNA polymerase sigma factor [Planctomycetes bacterium]|nr:RNA polymerase sigma factor [Planctomycetota bacterium]